MKKKKKSRRKPAWSLQRPARLRWLPPPAGAHALILVGLERVANLEQLMQLEFGRGFTYNRPLSLNLLDLDYELAEQLVGPCVTTAGGTHLVATARVSSGNREARAGKTVSWEAARRADGAGSAFPGLSLTKVFPFPRLPRRQNTGRACCPGTVSLAPTMNTRMGRAESASGRRRALVLLV